MVACGLQYCKQHCRSIQPTHDTVDVSIPFQLFRLPFSWTSLENEELDSGPCYFGHPCSEISGGSIKLLKGRDRMWPLSLAPRRSQRGPEFGGPSCSALLALRGLRRSLIGPQADARERHTVEAGRVTCELRGSDSMTRGVAVQVGTLSTFWRHSRCHKRQT